jgi:hypothetical protein
MNAGEPPIQTPRPRRISDPSITSQARALFARLWTYALVNQVTHMLSDVEDWLRSRHGVQLLPFTFRPGGAGVLAKEDEAGSWAGGWHVAVDGDVDVPEEEYGE